jgi:hypothetical protein
MGKDKEKAEQGRYLGDFRPTSPTVGCNDGHNQGKQKAVSRATMKKITIPLDHESNQNIDVRKIGEGDDVDKDFPEWEVIIGFGIKIMDGQTGRCMSQGQRHDGTPYDFIIKIADCGFD